MRGILHVHSNYSYDGFNTIEEIADWAEQEGLDFVIITDHDIDFNESKFHSLAVTCQSERNRVKVLPAIEYSFGGKRELHINVLGLNHFIESDNQLKDIPGFLKEVKLKGGFSILNHPRQILDLLTDIDLSNLDGIELWNTKNDFRYSPDINVFKYVRNNLPFAKTFVTSDIHSIPTESYAIVEINNSFASEESILNAFRDGLFVSIFKGKIIKSTINYMQISKVLMYISSMHWFIYNTLKHFANSLKIKYF